MHELFLKQAAAAPKEEKEKEKGKEKGKEENKQPTIALLESKRATQLEIGLRYIKFTGEELAGYLASCDTSALNAERSHRGSNTSMSTLQPDILSTDVHP